MAENEIELNGKRYDAVTGAYLGVSHTKAVPATVVPQAAPRRGRNIDGFVRPTAAPTHTAKPTKHAEHAAKAKAAPKATKPVRHDIVAPAPSKNKIAAKPRVVHPHQHGIDAHPHHPEHAKTLMRRAVHKPAITLKPAIKPQTPAEVPARPLSAIQHKHSALQVDPTRLERAKAAVRHSGVRRFMPARQNYAPEAIAAMPRRARNDVPVIAVRPAPPAAHHVRPQHQDIFEAALARAESYKEPKREPKRHVRRRRLVNTFAGIAAFLVIGGFIAYLNIPNIQMHIASFQAGFQGTMPGYKPTGYALQGGVRRSGNTISLHFQSGENGYTITQQASDWNSQTLVDNTTALAAGKYKTVQAAGRIIYLYGNTNAVWVSGGVRYDVSGNTPLSTNDIEYLASSL